MAETVDLQLLLRDVRLDRVSLATPFISRDNPKIDPTTGNPVGEYGADLILAESHPQLTEIKALMRAAVVKKFGEQAPAVIERMVANNKLCLHRGDIDRSGKSQYAGKLFIRSKNSDQPNVVVTEGGVNIATVGTPVVLTPLNPSYPYSGCFADAIIRFNAYNHPKGGQGVTAYLLGVQFRRHGEKLKGSSIVSASEFGLIAQDADGAAPQAATSGSEGLI